MEIIESVHWVDGVNGNVYLVMDENPLLVDTGLPRNAKKILHYINSCEMTPSELSMIVLTHAHLDHVGGVQELKERTGAEVLIHEKDAAALAGEEPLPSSRGFSVFSRIISFLLRFGSVYPDKRIKNGKIGEFSVIETPGHTPGSIALYDEKRGMMFVGDTLRVSGGTLRGPPSPPTINMTEAKRSIEKIAEFEFDILLSGHGKPLHTNASEKVRNFIKSKDFKKL